MNYKAKLWLNNNQYLAVLDKALVIVTVDKDGNPLRYAIFDGKEEKDGLRLFKAHRADC